MANEVLVGLKIGAAVSGTLRTAFGSARSTVQQLGRATDSLTVKQQQLGAELSAALARGGTGIGRMRRQYDEVGRTIDQIRLKQERLTASIARGETLKNQRADLRGQAMETIGTAAVLGAPLVKALRTGISFQDEVRDIRITAGFDASQETELAKMVRGTALAKNQTQGDVNVGVGTLVAGGISDLQALKEYTPIMAEVATATKASMEDLGASTIALRDSMNITAQDYKAVMNMLAAGGKEGQFELQDMAKWLPTLAAQYGAMGQTGKDAVAELTAALQVVRMGAGSSDEAANNYKNFISKLTAPDTIKAFKDAGIDLKNSMQQMATQGFSPVASMLNIIGAYLGSAGPDAAKKYQEALKIKDDQERDIALQRLDEAYKLGELFRDQQVMAALRPLLANRDKLADIESASKNAADQDVIGADFAVRMDTAGSSIRAFQIGLNELGITLSDALLPAVNELLKDVIPVVRQFSVWASKNGQLIKWTIGLAGGLLAGKLAFIGLHYGVNLALSPLNAMSTTVTALSARWTVLRGMLLGPVTTGASRLSGVLYGLSGGFAALGGVIAATPIGWIIAGIAGIAVAGLLIYKYWEPIKAWTSGFFEGLIEGLGPIGEAFSAAFAPIAPLVSELGVLLQPVVQWFRELLIPVQLSGEELGKASSAGLSFGRVVGNVLSTMLAPLRLALVLIGEIPKVFQGGIAGVSALIASFSPLEMFYRSFAGVLGYLGIELPGKFTEFGGMLVQGLISGITRMAGPVKDSIVGIGTSIKDWFAGTLGIHSPSRVFIGYGRNIGEGAAIGIASQTGLVRQSALAMASSSSVPLAPPNLQAAATSSSAFNGAAAGSMEINFSPVIQVQGGGDVKDQVQAGLQQGYAEFERMMQRWQQSQQRLSFKGGAF
ncbi:TPA: phage tail tape measure protein [Pseudomonas aeruginosa]|nr:phage tail tape measure protein [Pseudomonas aeruginosa]